MSDLFSVFFMSFSSASCLMFPDLMSWIKASRKRTKNKIPNIIYMSMSAIAIYDRAINIMVFYKTN